MEDQILKILEQSRNTYVPTMTEINDEKYKLINKIYKKYTVYHQNLVNKETSLNNLDNYHCIDFNDIKPGIYFKYISTKYFYDIELINGGIVIKKYKNKILYKNSLGLFTVKNDNYFFRKLTAEELAKIKLIETLKDLKN